MAELAVLTNCCLAKFGASALATGVVGAADLASATRCILRLSSEQLDIKTEQCTLSAAAGPT